MEEDWVGTVTRSAFYVCRFSIDWKEPSTLPTLFTRIAVSFCVFEGL